MQILNINVGRLFTLYNGQTIPERQDLGRSYNEMVKASPNSSCTAQHDYILLPMQIPPLSLSLSPPPYLAPYRVTHARLVCTGDANATPGLVSFSGGGGGEPDRPLLADLEKLDYIVS